MNTTMIELVDIRGFRSLADVRVKLPGVSGDPKPAEMLPDVILLDEPELGLHPAAVTLIGGMIKSVSRERQIIVATQSPLLVDVFNLEEIIVLDIRDGRTEFHNLDTDHYKLWLEEGYSHGELWQKNLFEGRP